MNYQTILRVKILFLFMSCFLHGFAENVERPSGIVEEFQLVNDVSDLNDGDRVVVVSQSQMQAMTSTPNASGNRLCSDTVRFDTDKNIVYVNENVQIWTLKKTKDYFSFYADGYGFLNNGSSSTDDRSINLSDDQSNTTMSTISFSKDDNHVSIYFSQGSYPRYLCKMTGGSLLFGCSISYSKMEYIHLYKQVKEATYMTFDTEVNEVINVNEGQEDFVSPKASVYALSDNKEIKDSEITYSSSNTAIADVDDQGNVTFGKGMVYGNVTITAFYAGNEVYSACKATYIINYIEKDRIQTKVTFGDLYDKQTIIVRATKESDFIPPVATLYPEGIGNVVYKSSNEDVVKVDDNGNVKFINFGNARITASYTGNIDYKSSSAWYTIRYLREQIVFSSDQDSFKNLPASSYKSGKYNLVDSLGVDHLFNNSECMKSRISNPIFILKSSATSPVYDVPNGYTITVEFYQEYSNKKPRPLTLYYKKDGLNVKVEGQVFERHGSLNEANGTGYRLTGNIPVASCFVLSPGNIVKISRIQIDLNPVCTIEISDEKDNSEILKKYDGQTVNVDMHRTLVADKWNTFCVPFDVVLENGKISGTEAIVREFDKIYYDNSIMQFKSTDRIVSGRSYLIKPIGIDIENPEWKNVVIKNVETEICGDVDLFYMKGVYSPYTFNEEACKNSLFINGDAQFRKPIADTRMKGLRSYFVCTSSAMASNMKVSLDDNDTSLEEIPYDTQNNVIYSIDGMYVGDNLEKLPKGIYIVNGKKYIK